MPACQTTCRPTPENAVLVWCPCCCQPPDATSHSTGALDRRSTTHLNVRPLKVRPGLEVEKAGVQDGREASICGAEVAAAEALMLPNGLQ